MYALGNSNDLRSSSNFSFQTENLQHIATKNAFSLISKV